jgi:hypothetical protein
MANLIKTTHRNAYIRVTMPIEQFRLLSQWFAGDQYALRELRHAWEAGVTHLMREVPPSQPRAAPGSSAQEGQQ